MKNGKGKRVLLVDEDRVFQELMEICLRQEGYSLVSVGDGTDAVVTLETDEIWAVILELMLPMMDGMRLLKWIRDSKKRVPVLVVTVAGDEAIRNEAIGAGASDFFHKPLHAEPILRWLNQIEKSSNHHE